MTKEEKAMLQAMAAEIHAIHELLQAGVSAGRTPVTVEADYTAVETQPQTAQEPPQEAQAHTQAEASPGPAITAEEIMAYNKWLSDCARYLGPTGYDDVTGAIRDLGMQSVTDVGQDRGKLDQITAKVQALVAAKSNA